MKAEMKLTTRILLMYLLPCVVFSIVVITLALQMNGLLRSIEQTDRGTQIFNRQTISGQCGGISLYPDSWSLPAADTY